MATEVAAIPDVMAIWKDGWTFSLIKFALISAVMLVVLIMLFAFGNLQEIAKNFPRYRCNPIFMPFASFFGYDTKENFNFCLTSIFNLKAAEIFSPIYTLLGGFTDIIKLVVDVALGIRKLFSNFLFGVNNFVRNVRDRIQGLLFNVRMSFMKINNLMGRVYGTMYAVLWMGMSATTAGFNIADNDLVKFVFEFCFDPNTPIALADGTTKAIKDVVIGDVLSPLPDGTNPVVTSTLLFNGKVTPMVKINEVIVSAEHYVQISGGAMVPAEQHPDAITHNSIPQLVCLNVTGHKFRVGELIVADYDEHDTPAATRTTQAVALKALNGATLLENPVDDYSLGIDGTLEIRLKSNEWKPISQIQLEEEIWNAGRVIGIVTEHVEQPVLYNGSLFAPAQIIYNHADNKWKRLANLPHQVADGPKDLHMIFTDRGGTMQIRNAKGEIYYIRDYREVPLPEMEAAYINEFAKCAISCKS